MARAKSTTGAAPAAVKATHKTAVVVVHGMGEQRPMDTLWGLVEALWTRDPDITGRYTDGVYPKPDGMSRSFELRRITTRRVPLEAGLLKRADFFEFYWAHMMTGNTVKGVTSWLGSLLIRRPSTVPRRLIFPWIAGLVLFTGTAALLALAATPEGLREALGLPGDSSLTYLIAAAVAFGFGALASAWLAPVAGDAARYLSATPDNVEARQKIREGGLDLLTRLHESGDYDRIVLVCHSLGCVVGYDILNHAWGRLSEDRLKAHHPAASPALAALGKLELAAGRLRHATGLAEIGDKRVAFRAAQRAYLDELARPVPNPKPAPDTPPLWLVSDFVTLGCPLSKADVLLARNAKEFEVRKARREAPASPPWLEKDSPSAGKFRFSYPVDEPVRIPHHAAVFAPVVWTNIYFDNFLLAFGDIISGPVAALFGRGVLDVRLRIGAPVFRHLHYWKAPTSTPPRPWLKALRRAVNLKRSDDAALWGVQATAAEIEAATLP
jgi:hypothetical protein